MSRLFPSNRLFVPILAGATLKERLIACLGALIGIGLTGAVSGQVFGHGAALPLIVAPIGASAVLLFAVPASPLAQPWSIVGGNTISALVGVAAAHFIPDPVWAIGVGVSLAIAAMSFTRCLHPPGGAAALTAIIGGQAVTDAGFLFPFVPVALNSAILVATGIAFHKLSRRAYPHRAAPVPANTHRTQDPPAETRVGFQQADIDAALELLDETFDIDRGDLDRLLRQVELQALVRKHGKLLCQDIMSRDVVRVGVKDETSVARALLLEHNIRTLPVTGGDGKLEGVVGLREVIGDEGPVGHVMSKPAVAAPDQAALSLIPVLTDGRSHAVIVTGADGLVLGLITQTDLLAALAREALADRTG